MKHKILFAALALVVSGAALADNKSGIITSLSGTAYDSVVTNSQNAVVGNTNQAAGAFTGLSGSYGGMSSSGVQIVAAPIDTIQSTGSGTYNSIGRNASSLTGNAAYNTGAGTVAATTAAGIQGYGNVDLTAGGLTTGTAYLAATSGVQSESSSANGAYDAHSKSITGQTASLMGGGAYLAGVTSGAGGMSQSGDLTATGFNTNTASAGVGTAYVDALNTTFVPLGAVAAPTLGTVGVVTGVTTLGVNR